MSCPNNFLTAIQLFVASAVTVLMFSQHSFVACSSKPAAQQSQHAPPNRHLTEPVTICHDVRMLDGVVSKDFVVIGIAGGSGSGKTTLARAVYDAVGGANITYISHDSYYKDLSHLSMEERAVNNFDHPESLETSLLVEHVKQLTANKGVKIPSYDFSTHSRLEATEQISPQHVILVEGILILSDPALYSLFDIKIFVDTDDDIRLIRRIERDVAERGRTAASVITQYMATVRPMHIQFVEPSRKNADIIVPEGVNNVAVDLVVSKLKMSIANSERKATCSQDL